MWFSKLLFVALCVVLSAGAGTARASGGPALMQQIKATMAKVQSDKTVDARTEAAEHLATLTQKISSKEVTEALVTDLTSLLDSPNDSVRYWVARALGNLGPAAKAAVPKLQAMLPKADCINGAITSASGIRYALIKMALRGTDETYPKDDALQSEKGHSLGIECEFPLSRVSGWFSGMPSFPQCQAAPCLFLECLDKFCRSQRAASVGAAADCQ